MVMVREDIDSVAQGIIIVTAVVLIIYSLIRRIIEGTSIELTEVGIGVMLVSIVISIFLSRHLLKVSQATGSVVQNRPSFSVLCRVSC